MRYSRLEKVYELFKRAGIDTNSKYRKLNATNCRAAGCRSLKSKNYVI
jgi:hypothetical protein